MANILQTIAKAASSIRPLGIGIGPFSVGGPTVGEIGTAVGKKVLETTSKINPKLGGKFGKGVDVVGKFLGDPFPEAYASEKAQSAGGEAQRQKQIQEQTKQVQEQAKTTGQYSAVNYSDSDKNWARDTLDKMNKGQIIWDDNVRSAANRILAVPGGGGQPPPPVTKEDVLSKISTEEKGSLTDKDVEGILGKYAGESKDNAQKIADEILASAKETSEREYQDVLSALGVQKKEISTLSEQQKKRVGEEKKLGIEELEAKEETETGKIEKEKTGFEEEVEDTRQVLARNWRDMSMEVQRIMRARGASDSSFAASKETDVLRDFNSGLTQLAKKSTDAIANFGEATVETNKFYTREKNKLEVESRQRDEDIDTWVREQVQSIQTQENKALSKKLNEIRVAVSQGNQLKIQTAQSITDKKFALEAWLIQTRVNYQNAVALAAKGKVGDAIKNIKDYRDLAKEAYDLVTKGGYEPMVFKDSSGKLQYAVHGKLPTGTDDYVLMTPGGFDILTQNVYGSLTKGNDIYGQFGIGGQVNVNPTALNTARSQAGLPPLGVSPTATEEPSLLDRIGAFLK